MSYAGPNNPQRSKASSDSPPVSRTPTTFHFLAGLSTGILSAALLQPADLLKTRVQQSRSASLLGTLRSIAAGRNSLRQLWRGTLPSTIRTGLGSALYFTTLNSLRQQVARSRMLGAEALDKQRSSSSLPKLGNTANLTTGALARAGAGFVMMPVTVLKVRFESSLYSYPSLWAAARDILRKEGPRGFFSGFGATAVRDAPYAGLYVLLYEEMKSILGNVGAGKDAVGEGGDGRLGDKGNMMSVSRSATTNFVSGVFAAGTATALTNPFDAVKTRLQLMPGKYGNMVRAAKLMLKEEGARTLFDGLALRMARKAMSSALAWTIYEEMVRRAESRWMEDGVGNRESHKL